MGDRRTEVLHHGFRVPLRAHDAFPLFTARGEREWAHDWHPHFPATVADDAQRGTVFEVLHGDLPSTWIVTRSDPGRAIEYARVVAGRTAALVSVTCEPAGCETEVTVTYEITALTAAGDEAVKDLCARFEEFIGEWEQAISEMCRRRQARLHA